VHFCSEGLRLLPQVHILFISAVMPVTWMAWCVNHEP